MKQRDLAEWLGVKEIEVSRWETGRATPAPEIKKRVAAALGRPSYEIFDE